MKPDTKRRLYKYVFLIHLYSGLFCSVYLMIAGLSVLNFQHKFLPERDVKTITYTKYVPFNPSLKADTLTKLIRSVLEIKGHIPPWDIRRNKTGLYQFKIQRPGRTFEVNLNPGSDLIEINETHHSIGKILRAMHFGSSKNDLNDKLLDSWAYHAQCSNIFAFLAVVSSLFFWFMKSVRSRSQWVIIIITGTFSVGLILYVWLVG